MSKLFDDEEDDQEYQAQTQPETTQQDYSNQQESYQQEQYNYTQQQEPEPVQHQEYNPYVEPAPQYEAPKEQAEDTQPGEKAKHNIADQRLRDAAATAKNTLLNQINNFNAVSEDSGLGKGESFEAEDSSSHLFGVSNPVKIGSVVKYTVTG